MYHISKFFTITKNRILLFQYESFDLTMSGFMSMFGGHDLGIYHFLHGIVLGHSPLFCHISHMGCSVFWDAPCIHVRVIRMDKLHKNFHHLSIHGYNVICKLYKLISFHHNLGFNILFYISNSYQFIISL